MKKSKSSHQWLQRHFKDPFVKNAKKSGYRSRAAFKFLEIQTKDRLVKPGMTVVDLGAAPGGWSQVITEQLNGQGQIIALDRLPIDPIPHVQFIEGDFTQPTVLQQLKKTLAGRPVDLVVSDMAPNMSGIPERDQAQSLALVELAFDFAIHHLKPNGHFLTKVFQGEDLPAFLVKLKKYFKEVLVRKPKASRSESSETYFLAKGKNAPLTNIK